ncbi:MAG: Hsp20/alpha crystallin family protein [Deltaproteobacteria bacterium]|nr:Hsp20/alpha crystallin family protein [Deltaproteobacteria bacterium]
MGRKKDETFEMLFSMKNKMDRFFSVSDNEFNLNQHPGNQWSPSMDLFDSGDEYLMIVEVPGVGKDQLELTICADKVVIKGWREDSAAFAQAEVLCLERVRGRFERVILLSDSVDADGVKASLKNGVLTVHLPKKIAEVGKKSISIE